MSVNVPSGYKQTKVGVYPDDWKEVSVSSFVNEKANHCNEENIPLYSLTIESGVVPKSKRYERAHLVKDSENAYKLVELYDFVYNPMNLRFGALAMHVEPKNVKVSTYYNIFSTNDNMVNRDYIYAYLKSERIMFYYNRMAIGSLEEKKRVHFKAFENFIFPLPSLKEQQKIAQILTTWDDAISKQEALIKTKEELKKGLMQKLLSGEVRFGGGALASQDKRDMIKLAEASFSGTEVPAPEYKQTKIGVIPEDWDVVKIRDVTDYVDYRGKTPKKVENGILLVTARNIKQGYLDYETSKEYIAKDDYQNVMSRGIPQIGDVLLTTEAPLGNIAQIDNENIALAQRVIKFRAKNDLDNTYLKYHFLSERFQAYLLRLAIGTTVLGIQGKQLHKMLIPFPSPKEQQKIAQVLTLADKEIDLLKNELETLKEQKKGLMQKLLTGEVRVEV